MSALAYPSGVPVPARAIWRLVPNTTSFRSPLSRAVQTAELPGAAWRAQLFYAPLDRIQSDILGAWIDRLRGQSGRALLWPFQKAAPRGTLAGAVLVKGAGQTGATLALDGATPGTTLLTGDFLETGGQLFKAVADAIVDGGGNITVTVEAPIRAAPADNAVVTFVKPTARMKLVSDDNPFAFRSGGLSGPLADSVVLEFEEAFT